MKVLMFGWEFPPFNSGGLGVECGNHRTVQGNRPLDALRVADRDVDADVNDVPPWGRRWSGDVDRVVPDVDRVDMGDR